MKKALSLTLACLITASATIVGGCKKSSYTVPEFKENKNYINFTAYSGPTVENWSGTTHNPNTVTEEHYRELAEAGFTKVLALLEGASSAGGADVYERIENRSKKAQSDALLCLEQAAKFGIKYYVRDWAFYGLVTNYTSDGITEYDQYEKIIAKMFDENNEYIKHPNYGGNFAHDEPNKQQLEKIAWQCELYNKYIAKNGRYGGSPIVNLNPCYVTGKGLSLDNDMSYAQYVDYYFEKVAPYTGYVCWDYYPFVNEQYDGSFFREMYLYNYEIMALKCKETGYELHNFIQSVGDWTGMRKMSCVGDFRLQIATSMAFGTREMIYYMYCNGGNAKTDDTFALLDYNTGELNWTYYAAKQANNEAKMIEDAYAAFAWDGVMYNNADELYDNQNFANLTKPMESHPRIKNISSTEDTLVGVFKGKENDVAAGMDAFMIINFVDPYFDKNDEVTVTFNDAKALLTYRLGKKEIIELGKDGKYTFKLYPGEGRFVIPLK